jgi:hypothetical protein
VRSLDVMCPLAHDVMVCAFGVAPSALPRNDVLRHLASLLRHVRRVALSLHQRWPGSELPVGNLPNTKMHLPVMHPWVPEHPRQSHLPHLTVSPQAPNESRHTRCCDNARGNPSAPLSECRWMLPTANITNTSKCFLQAGTYFKGGAAQGTRVFDGMPDSNGWTSQLLTLRPDQPGM